MWYTYIKRYYGKKGDKMTNKEKFEYVIHTNELEGHIFTEEEKEIIRKVAEGEMSSKEALEIFSKSTKNLD